MFEPPSYGDLTKLNKTKGILYHVGRETLETIVKSYLDLLHTSSVIYESDGSYASALFSSSFCRLMDQHARKLCGSDDNAEALDSGKWLCHESCWSECSKKSIETGKPVDLKVCEGGISIYAVPIRSEGKIIGSINIGYGNPPTDEDKLQELSEKYNVKKNELREVTNGYQRVPEFVVEAVKRNLHLAAELIGEIYTRKKRELELVKRHEELEKKIKETYEQLLHSEKLYSLGKLTGSIAHEFNNPLYGVRSLIEGVLDDELNEQKAAMLRLALKECDRMADLIFKLREFYAPSVGKIESLDLNKILEDIALLMRKKLEERKIKLIKDFCDEDCRVRGVEDQLKQVCMNLIQNAEESISGEDGCIILKTRCGAAKLVLTVTDNGCGISESNMKRIFEPFYSTKLDSKGSGLGLSVCYSIIKKHNGNIFAKPVKPKGTCFTVELPLSEKSS
ncbi:MAG: ATP-binding protein [Nitrospinales bacterium]